MHFGLNLFSGGGFDSRSFDNVRSWELVFGDINMSPPSFQMGSPYIFGNGGEELLPPLDIYRVKKWRCHDFGKYRGVFSISESLQYGGLDRCEYAHIGRHGWCVIGEVSEINFRAGGAWGAKNDGEVIPSGCCM